MWLTDQYTRIINIGTEQIKNPEEAKRIRLSNLMALTVFTTGTPFTIIFYLFGSKLSGLVLVAYILSFLFVFRLHKKKYYVQAKIIMLIIMNTAVIHYSIWYGLESGIHRMLIPFACIPFLVFDQKNTGLITCFVSISFFSFVFIDFVDFNPALSLSEYSLSIIYHGITLISCLWLLIELYYLSNQNFIAYTILSQQRKEQTAAIVIAQENERKRIARDFHDSFGQLLSALKINLELIPDKQNKFVLNSIEIADSSLIEMTNIAFNLMPATLENKGLIPALEELVDRTRHTKIFSINFYLSNIDQMKINKDQQYNIYRIIQEALNNIIKYSKANEVNLHLVNFENILTITIEDNGIGFVYDKLVNSGRGLQNMQARTEWLDGTFNIDSGKNIGTTIIVAIPIDNLTHL